MNSSYAVAFPLIMIENVYSYNYVLIRSDSMLIRLIYNLV